MSFDMNHSAQLSQKIRVMTSFAEDSTEGYHYPTVTFQCFGPNSYKSRNPECKVDVGFSFKKKAPLVHMAIGGNRSLAASWTAYSPKYMIKACIQPLIDAALKKDFSKNIPDKPGKVKFNDRLKKVKDFLASKPVPSNNYPEDFYYNWLTAGSNYVHNEHFGKDIPRHSSNYEEDGFLHDVMAFTSLSLGNRILDPILNSYRKLVGDFHFNTILDKGPPNELFESAICFPLDSSVRAHILKFGWSKMCHPDE
jgi:hypothetical protein